MTAGLYSALGRRHCARPFGSHTPLTRIPSACQTCRDIGNKLVFSKSVDACWGRPEFVSCLEHVQVRLTLSHNQRGKLAIHLISPLGTHSTLLFPRYIVNSTIKIFSFACASPPPLPRSHAARSCACCLRSLALPFACSSRRGDVNESGAWCFSFRPNDFSSEGFNNWTFMTTHSWDEEPQGEWTLEIENSAANERDYGSSVRLRYLSSPVTSHQSHTGAIINQPPSKPKSLYRFFMLVESASPRCFFSSPPL